jgi:tetratricopeptide (TPR) repeat protein
VRAERIENKDKMEAAKLYKDAEVLLRQAIKEEPLSSWRAHVNLGIALERQSDHAGAAAAFRRAIAIDPNYAITHCNLGAALYNQGDHASAAAAYRRTIAIDPNDAFSHCNLGVSLLCQGDDAGAAAACQAALAIDPQDGRASQLLAALRNSPSS